MYLTRLLLTRGFTELNPKITYRWWVHKLDSNGKEWSATETGRPNLHFPFPISFILFSCLAKWPQFDTGLKLSAVLHIILCSVLNTFFLLNGSLLKESTQSIRKKGTSIEQKRLSLWKSFWRADSLRQISKWLENINFYIEMDLWNIKWISIKLLH